MKKIKVLPAMKYLSIINVIGLLLMLILRLDYPDNVRDIGWTPLYIPFCYALEPIFGLWTGYLIMLVPVLAMIALWQFDIKSKLFLQAIFRLELCKYTMVLLLRWYWVFAGVRFAGIDFICVGASLILIALLRRGLRELNEDKELKWGAIYFICLALIIPFIQFIQYNEEGIPSTNYHISARIELDKAGIVAETKFRVVRYSPEAYCLFLSTEDLDVLDAARFEKNCRNQGIDMPLILRIYKIEQGQEKEIYMDKIDKLFIESESYDIYSIYLKDFKPLKLNQGIYRLTLECLKPLDAFDGVDTKFFIRKRTNYLNFYY